ncbi:DNA-binding transcriptional regulator, ArsR family [Mesobacillus persicus]|uniref:DNA-binding transcriptional regulator, ArsR family n=1 Tax=Mesobacillus persicus TaxID=930146 RepID=A0A1H8JI59_9BACI|nr:metalloregulator ArsR/SmtB family transcription factor [Mesobacillus persicus]SEN79897.1 DNA-binding transcriptional regulator, ArsR family [Mesobacillus persicus]
MGTTWSLKSNEEMCGIRGDAEKQFPITLSSNKLESSAGFFKGLADETRLRIISLLWLEDLCMCEIVAALDGASSTISHHLKIMEKGGVIESRREGKFTIYRVNKEKLTPVLPLLNN